jgi:hypothetical protein
MKTPPLAGVGSAALAEGWMAKRQDESSYFDSFSRFLDGRWRPI